MNACIQNNSKSENSLLKLWANHSAFVDKGQMFATQVWLKFLTFASTNSFWKYAKDTALYDMIKILTVMKCAFFLLEKTQILHLYSLISNQMMSLITGAKFVEAKSMLKA